jgi:hypothetical protein
MQENDRKIDDLLKRNTDQQLAGFDWDRLHADISEQIDHARAPQRRISIFKTAAAAAATAAVLLLSLAVWKTAHPPVSPPQDEPRTVKSVVKLESTTATCTLTMIDTNGHPKEETDKSTRISIIRTHSQQADTGPDRDTTDLICLL